MSTSGSLVPGEGISGEAVQQVTTQTLAQLQDKMWQEWQGALQQLQNKMEEDKRLQEQEASKKLEEVKREVEETKRNMQAAVQKLEERVADLERRISPCEEEGKAESTAGQGSVEILEGRLNTLEASVQRALESVFPRINVLVTHLETKGSSSMPSTASAPSAPSPTSASKSSSAPSPRPAVAFDNGSQRSFADIMRRLAVGEELIRAAGRGRLEEVERLLDADSHAIKGRADGYTPLMAACTGSHASVASLLLERGADVHVADRDGRTALHLAAADDRSGRCVALLVAAGAPVDSGDRWRQTPLHVAAVTDNGAAARALVAAGASKALRDSNGESPLDLARSDAVRRLLRP